MPRIKMTDKGGFTIKGEGVDIDTSGKFSKSVFLLIDFTLLDLETFQNMAVKLI